MSDTAILYIFPADADRGKDIFDKPVTAMTPLAGHLPLSHEFEPGRVKMVGFETSFRRGGLQEQDLENAPGNAHHTFILANADAELDDGALRIPSGVWRKAEKHARPPGQCSANVPKNI